MYQVNYFNAKTGKWLTPIFNSIEAVDKFLKERLNHKDTQEYIGHLRDRKKSDAVTFRKSEMQLYPLYGDVDDNIPTIIGLKIRLDRYGSYEYRLGTLNPMFQEGFGCMYFKVSTRINDVSKSISSNQSDKLNILSANRTELLSNEYSRPYHE